jgi:hypothetical protein
MPQLDQMSVTLTEDEVAEIARRMDTDREVTTTVPEVTPTDSLLSAREEDYEPTLIVFREVPGYDPRTLVLSFGDQFIDLQLCTCLNKYKKRFTQFLKENPELYENVKNTAVQLAEGDFGKTVSITDILEYLRLNAKLNTRADRYLAEYTHDFTLDSLPRAYLIRKLMMEEPALFDFFELAPIKCRSACGYGHGASEQPEPEEEDDNLNIAGF